MTRPKVQRIAKRLKLDPEFQALCARAQADPDNLKKYVNETRERFNLSRYWEGFLQHALMLGGFPDNQMASGLAIENEPDPIIGRSMYKLCIYPETTQKEVVATYGRIAKIYREREYTADIREAKLDPIEFRALTLHYEDKGHEEITKILDKEFPERNIIKSEVASLINRAKEKSNR